MIKKANYWLIVIFTGLALIAFAGNSIINRMALKANTIDALSFTNIRLVSGAITLWVLNTYFSKTFSINLKIQFSKHLKSALYLLLYGITFSLAYKSLNTSMGALLLFGTVQFTMLCYVFAKGEKPLIVEWLGLILAFSGLVYLLFPGIEAPSFNGAALMITAGISWTFYTLQAKGFKNPLAATMYNFIFTIPFVILVVVFNLQNAHLTQKGVLLACISGAVTSGIGYAIWYKALTGLTNIQAGLLQLFVPIIAAFGGFIILNETISYRVLISGFFILSGILIAITAKKIVK